MYIRILSLDHNLKTAQKVKKVKEILFEHYTSFFSKNKLYPSKDVNGLAFQPLNMCTRTERFLTEACINVYRVEVEFDEKQFG